MNQNFDGGAGAGAVYTQSNDPAGNQVIAFRRAGDGKLARFGTYDTGGLGTGKPHLASQGSVVLSVALPRLVALVEGRLKGGGVGLDVRRRKDQLLIRIDGGDAPDTTRSVPRGLLEADAGEEAGTGLGDSDSVLADPREPPRRGAQAAAQALADSLSGVEPPGDVPRVSRSLQAVNGSVQLAGGGDGHRPQHRKWLPRLPAYWRDPPTAFSPPTRSCL